MKLKVKDLLWILIGSFIATFTFIGAISGLQYTLSSGPIDDSFLNGLKGLCLILWIIGLFIGVCIVIDFVYNKWIKVILNYEVIK